MRRLSAPQAPLAAPAANPAVSAVGPGLATKQPCRPLPLLSSATRGSGGALFLAPLLALVCFSAVPEAAAQTTQTFVSNTGQTSKSSGLFLNFDVAMQFTTGNHITGYRLSSIEVSFRSIRGSFSYSAGIYTRSGNNPGTLIGNLTPPTLTQSNTPQTLEFTATETSGILLEPNTQYVFLIDSEDSTNSAFTSIQRTGSGSEDAGSASGWSIGDLYTRGANTTHSFNRFTGNFIQMAIKGTESPPRLTLGAPSEATVREDNKGDAGISVLDLTLIGSVNPTWVYIAVGGTATPCQNRDYRLQYKAPGDRRWLSGACSYSETFGKWTYLFAPQGHKRLQVRVVALTDNVADNGETVELTLERVSPLSLDQWIDIDKTKRTVTINDVGPIVANAIPPQRATAGTAFSYTFPADTFTDPNSGTLTYTATKRDGTPLPTWLSFSSATRTFSGTPASGDVGALTVRVTASDGNGGAIYDDFTISISSAPIPPTVGAGPDGRILVSNLGQSTGPGALLRFHRGQGFTTGPSDNGFLLQSVEMVVRACNSSTTCVDPFTSTTELTIDVRNESSGRPGSTIGTLKYDRAKQLFTTTSGIRLEANTRYFLVAPAVSGGNAIGLLTTSSHNEDSRAQPGWSINNQITALDPTPGSVWVFAGGSIIKMRLYGINITGVLATTREAVSARGARKRPEYAKRARGYK
ncbi:MAG: hypothetical protein F4Y10_07420, partial [Synechococcus sp. SB0663_bin_10]|nr:hypothetical protein [Synechococcus sp. SB0663_bin_10]